MRTCFFTTLPLVQNCSFLLLSFRILKPAFLPQANTQSLGVIAYIPFKHTTSWMSLCTNLDKYIQAKSSLRVSARLCWVRYIPAAHRKVRLLRFRLTFRRIYEIIKRYFKIGFPRETVFEYEGSFSGVWNKFVLSCRN